MTLASPLGTTRTAVVRRRRERLFLFVLFLALLIAFAALAALLVQVFTEGLPRLNAGFLTGLPSRFAGKAGAAPAIIGSLWIIGVCAGVAIPLGIGAALYLEEFADRESRVARVIEINIANLAGVPSIIYGLLGLAVFVRAFGLGRSVLAGGMTLALLVLPVIVISGREAIRSVPQSIRDASMALGATKWQAVSRQVLPAALPGFMTGIILAISRALGEAAPLITMGALTYVSFIPDSLTSRFTALPIQIYNWTSRPQSDFKLTAAAGIVVLLVVLLGMNAIAIMIRNRYERSW